jgi:hypothetical protein
MVDAPLLALSPLGKPWPVPSRRFERARPLASSLIIQRFTAKPGGE